MQLEEADYGMTEMALDPRDQVNPADYEKLFVRFVMYPKQDRKASREAGRPIFKEVPYVDIRIPGDRTSHQFRPAGDIDKRRWPKHWEAFESRKQQPSEGTPLEQWPAINRAMVEELRYFNIRTVEQLANISDTNASNFMGIREWQRKAQAFLALSKDSAEAEKMATALSERDARISSLEAQVGDLLKRIDSLLEAKASEKQGPQEQSPEEIEVIREPTPELEPDPQSEGI